MPEEALEWPWAPRSESSGSVGGGMRAEVDLPGRAPPRLPPGGPGGAGGGGTAEGGATP